MHAEKGGGVQAIYFIHQIPCLIVFPNDPHNDVFTHIQVAIVDRN